MKRLSICLFLTLLLAPISCLASNKPLASNEPLAFKNSAQEKRFYDLTQNLRCLVCQNQDLADSSAPLAHDLREEIFEMMQAGKSNEQIKKYLVDRYGDFVLYRPPFQGNTIALWLLPAVLLVAGGVIVLVAVRRHSRRATGEQLEQRD